MGHALQGKWEYSSVIGGNLEPSLGNHGALFPPIQEEVTPFRRFPIWFEGGVRV